MPHYSWRQTHPTTAFFLSPKPKINPYNLTGCIFECHNKLVKSVPNKERTDRCVDLTPSHNGSLIGSSIFRYQSLEPGQRYQKMAPNPIRGLRIPSSGRTISKRNSNKLPTNMSPRGGVADRANRSTSTDDPIRPGANECTLLSHQFP